MIYLKLINLLKIIFLAIVEGISEWLPISSSGHMLLIDEFIKLPYSNNFKEAFFILVQLGAIIAVVIKFFEKIVPFKKEKNKFIINKSVINMYKKVIVACLPGAIVAFLFDDFIDTHFSTVFIISIMLILYGFIFIFIENFLNKNHKESIEQISYKDAIVIGLFQVLSIIPGTSRSGATIIGAMLMGCSRIFASEFSFFLAIPVMFGYSFFKLIKVGFNFAFEEVILLITGPLIALGVSYFVVDFLMNYLKKHNFKVFGFYRIILGIFLMLYFF